VLLQEALDGFVQSQSDEDVERGQLAEACMEYLADYLLHFSDLFQEFEEIEEVGLEEWESSLDAHMEQLLGGDMEPALDLGSLELEQFEPEHLRDFLGWYLLRELDGDSAAIEEYCGILRDWLTFCVRRGWMSEVYSMDFLAVVSEMELECVRTAKAARLLFHYVRLGGGMSPRLRGKRFSRFIEGHARILRLVGQKLWLHFDSQEGNIGPVNLPEEIITLLKEGDVLDVELGKRSDTWLIVDIGPVYPANIYVEAEEFEFPDKKS
jgi:hypothetical protein